MSVSRQMLSTASDGSLPVADSRSPPAASCTRRCRAQLPLSIENFSFYSKKFCRRCRGCVALRGCAPSAGCVRSAQVVSALPKLPLRSSHHLPQGHHPRAACITSLIRATSPPAGISPTRSVHHFAHKSDITSPTATSPQQRRHLTVPRMPPTLVGRYSGTVSCTGL